MNSGKALCIREFTIKKSPNIVHLVVCDPQLAYMNEESVRVRIIHLQKAEEVVITLAKAYSGGSNCIVEPRSL